MLNSEASPILSELRMCRTVSRYTDAMMRRLYAREVDHLDNDPDWWEDMTEEQIAEASPVIRRLAALAIS